MSIERQAELFGIVVAAIFCGGLVYVLKGLSREWSLPWFLALCVGITAACLAIAWWLDRRAGRR
jgi:hypothetical protein